MLVQSVNLDLILQQKEPVMMKIVIKLKMVVVYGVQMII